MTRRLVVGTLTERDALLALIPDQLVPGFRVECARIAKTYELDQSSRAWDRVSPDAIWARDETGEAIQAAVNKAQSVGSREVYIPAGDYHLTAPIWVSSPGMRLTGAGDSTRLFVGSNAGVAILASSNPSLAGVPSGSVLDSIEIDHLYVEGTEDYQYFGLAYGRLILGRNVRDFRVHHCKVVGASMIGVCAEGAAVRCKVSSNTFENCMYSAVNLNGASHGSIVANNRIVGTTGTSNACAIECSGNCVVIANTIYGDANSSGGGILWGEGNYSGIGVVSGNYVEHCNYGIRGIYHGPLSVNGNVILCCSGNGGGILAHGGTAPKLNVACSDWVISSNLVVNCAPFQIDISAKNTVVTGNHCLNIALPTQSGPPGTPGYIDSAVVLGGIFLRADGASAVGNNVNGATHGIVLDLGVAPGAISANSTTNCGSRFAQHVPSSWKPFAIDSVEHVASSDGYVYRVTSSALPVAGYYSEGSRWECSRPSALLPKSAYVTSAIATVTTAAVSAGDSLVPTAAAIVGSHLVVGVKLVGGAVHWSMAAAEGLDLTLSTPIPAAANVASGATVWLNSWVTDIDDLRALLAAG
jgi:hypothetical protein